MTMSKYEEMARAAEPVLAMLDKGVGGYPSVTIFADGSGHLTVPYNQQEKATGLLRMHGVKLSGSRDITDKDDYGYYITVSELSGYTETLCPHCGKDTKLL